MKSQTLSSTLSSHQIVIKHAFTRFLKSARLVCQTSTSLFASKNLLQTRGILTNMLDLMVFVLANGTLNSVQCR